MSEHKQAASPTKLCWLFVILGSATVSG
ncbi:hypothetical protein TMatcc_003006 [Talaromyces marneffei ATCC 18224]